MISVVHASDQNDPNAAQRIRAALLALALGGVALPGDVGVDLRLIPHTAVADFVAGRDHAISLPAIDARPAAAIELVAHALDADEAALLAGAGEFKGHQ